MSELPGRRMHVSTSVEWRGREWLVGIGFAPDGICREVFANGVKSGQDMEAVLDDACVLTSLLLQAGHAVRDLAGRLGTEGEADAASPPTPASPIGAIVRRAAAIEAECGAGIRVAWAAKAARETS